MSSLAFLVTELQSLASETRRKHPEVREAAEKSLTILRASPEQATANLARDGPQSDDLLRPVFMGCATKNAKVVAISLGSLQRLIALKAVPLSAVPLIINTMGELISQGVDIQLRILQTLLSLLTNFPQVHGDLLGDALLLCFRLQESRIAVVSSTAAATLRQLVMFVFDKIADVDPGNQVAADEGNEVAGGGQIELPDGTIVTLHPSVHDAFSVFEDLCLLANNEHPNFLRLDALPKTFALELIESVLTNYHALFRKRTELLLLLQHHLCPLLLKALSERPLFPLTLRSTRVVFLLLKQFLQELVTEAEVFLMLLIRVIAGDSDSGSMDASGYGRPHWMRVLAMEIIRGLCGDPELIRCLWNHFDAQESGSKVFTALIAALNRTASEKPGALGVGAQMYGVGVAPSHSDGATGGSAYGLDVGAMAGMVAHAASATVSGVVGMMGNEAGLSLEGSAMKLQCIDQLDKAESPIIPDSYIYLLVLQCLVSLSEGFAALTLPLYTSIVIQRPRNAGDAVVRAPAALDITSLPENEMTTKQLKTVHDMVDNGWPGLLASLSFFISTNLSEDLFADVLGSIQNLTNVSGALGLFTPRDAFLQSLSKLAVPSRVVSGLENYVEPATPRSPGVLSAENLGLSSLAGSGQPPGLSERNLACLKALISIALFLAGSLGPSWFNVLEALQNADYVLFQKGSRTGHVGKRMGSISGPMGHMTNARSTSVSQQSAMPPAPQNQPLRHPLLTDLDLESIQVAMNRLFDASKGLEDQAYKYFVAALCRLSAEMIGMQSSDQLQMTESAEELSPTLLSPSPIASSKAAAHRRRASGIYLSRTMRSGDYGIGKLGVVSLLNIHRLIYRDPDIAWNAVTSHLLFVIRGAFVPPSIRIQAAEILNEILVVVPRNLTSAGELQAPAQRRVLEVLSQQVSAGATEDNPATVLEIRRMGLETLHQILQFSGHTLVVGWEMIFQMLGSVCKSDEAESAPLGSGMSTPVTATSPTRPRPPPLQGAPPKNNLVLVRIAFQSLTLVCDTLDMLSPEHLRLCISTLGQFGRQPDTNIALTAAESLLWGVSDSIQAKRKDEEKEPEYSALWMFLLLELLRLCTDARPDVRNGAIQTLFRTLQLYGATLSLQTWDECVWRIIFPLLDSLSIAAHLMPPPAVDASESQSSFATHSSPSQAWGDTKILALQSVGSVFHDFLVSKVMHLDSFDQAWDSFLNHVTNTFLQDPRSVSSAALRCLDKTLRASKQAEGDMQPAVEAAWERVWVAFDEMGKALVRAEPQSPREDGTGAPFTQESLQAFVDAIRTTYSLSGSAWDLNRLRRLLEILKGVMTYPSSPDYRPDVDGLTPVQSVVMDAINDIDLAVPGSPSLILRDISEYATLAFSASFELQSTKAPAPGSETRRRVERITYIALAKKTMPLLVQLYLRFESHLDIYTDGTLEQVLAAYSIPLKLKYDCPAPSKFGDDQPLWKTATTSFLHIMKHCAHKIKDLGDLIPGERVEGIWRQVLEAFRGALLADCAVAESFPLHVQEAEEKFDLSLIATLEIDVILHLGDARVPDHLVVLLAKTLENASHLHQEPDSTPMPTGSISSQKETHFGAHHDTEQIGFGTTGLGSLLPRERFAYWCFDLLFLICSNVASDNEAARRRIASLCLPRLLNRCHVVLSSYLASASLRGNAPFPRAQEEELLYVLRKLLDLQLWQGSLWAAFSDNPSKHCVEPPSIDPSLPASALIADAVERSPKAHLFHFYGILCDIASFPQKTPSAWVIPDNPQRNMGKLTRPESRKASGDFPVGLVGADRPDGETAEAVELDARHLAKTCLREIGKEIGA